MSTVGEDHPKFQSQIARAHWGHRVPGFEAPDRTKVHWDFDPNRPSSRGTSISVPSTASSRLSGQPPRCLPSRLSHGCPPTLSLTLRSPAEPPWVMALLARGDGGFGLPPPRGDLQFDIGSARIPQVLASAKDCGSERDAVFHHAIFTALGTGRWGPPPPPPPKNAENKSSKPLGSKPASRAALEAGGRTCTPAWPNLSYA